MSNEHEIIYFVQKFNEIKFKVQLAASQKFYEMFQYKRISLQTIYYLSLLSLP